ncbi:ribulose-phosphate 3-epimerase [Omnitrophica bacterium]|nr:ribulose-phosphate 3-epimerase [Candidatus Omnitrophota bacterium]
MTPKEKSIWIAPSILSADFSRLGEEIREVEQAGSDLLHVDVMDGHFVPNLTIGPPVIRGIRKATSIPLDVHLMIDRPERFIHEYIEAGADWLTIHVEACREIEETIYLIKKKGMKAGLSLRPKTPVEELKPYLSKLDLVLVMSVEPGFGGQSFMPETMDKVRALKGELGYAGRISVDGGINPKTARLAVEAGADILVAGTAVFGQKDRAQAVVDLKEKRF